MNERSGKWHTGKPKQSGVYLAKFEYLIGVLDQAWLIYDSIKDLWYTEFNEVVVCYSWMNVPFPQVSSRVPGLC